MTAIFCPPPSFICHLKCMSNRSDVGGGAVWVYGTQKKEEEEGMEVVVVGSKWVPHNPFSLWEAPHPHWFSNQHKAILALSTFLSLSLSHSLSLFFFGSVDVCREACCDPKHSYEYSRKPICFTWASMHNQHDGVITLFCHAWTWTSFVCKGGISPQTHSEPLSYPPLAMWCDVLKKKCIHKIKSGWIKQVKRCKGFSGKY